MYGDDLTIIVPLWRRTANLSRLQASIRRTVVEAETIYVVSADDAACARLTTADNPEWDGDGTGEERVLTVDWPGGSRGDYARKINAGYRASTRPFIFTAADDIEFTTGWYEAARALITEGETLVDDEGTEFYWQSGIGVVGTNDDANRRTFVPEESGYPSSTHSLVARWYADSGGCVDQDHVIYHEGYWHEYCDDELVQTAIARGVYAHALDAVVRHLHPIAGRADDDETYRHGRSGTAESRALFRVRRRMWDQNVGLPGVVQVRR